MSKIVAIVVLLGLASCQSEVERSPTTWADEIQELVASHPMIRDEEQVRSLIPYESITIERGPCFGSCPVYKMTINRNGTALLTTDHLLPREALRYSASIGLKDYARLAQVVEIARRAAPRAEYMGQWTDDFGVTITAKTAHGAWRVHDYGQVAPAELWALEELLHHTRSDLQWAGGVR
ncbi:DUF6438 domain-containing protein [Luteimonas sp. R10]|uniref:DUF6438 domain-containing protein n=1 Tax=Luteimonas sp. R10 TaxID=3108176 RepID=UPI00308D00AC|nr:DUF6438 domain-containing protein [Luteimonas sp. R10]